ncbi:hypothetical protein BDZ91DRAFT_772743 [Kalaharituber pfeilii]|nr:hypothetical protein BDZ91DRAFT_772743 [Kalaharituber pfeilii]
MHLQRTLYYGTFIHAPSLKGLDICERGAIGVNEYGKIAFVERDVQSAEDVLCRHPEWASTVRVVRSGGEGFFFPGFVDTHIHAPQYPNVGLFGTATLLDWLHKYTFPTEASFSSLSVARTIYTRIVNRTLSHGTTTAAYYATIHVPATNLLADICLSKGQRAFVGRVCMDCNAPKYYIDESACQAVQKTKATIDHVKKIDPGYSLITPIITPRFAVSCTRELLSALGDLAEREVLPIQTHISENEGEIKLVKKLFPDQPNYASVYDSTGLLNSRSILAHAVHITPEELKLVKKRDAKISHCPVSNSALSSGMARVRDMLDEGVDVGLGTDVSGGYSASVLEAGRQALLVSRLLAQSAGKEEQEERLKFEKDAKHPAERLKLSVDETLYLATLGGAKVVGLEHKIGSFERDKEWDAILVRLSMVLNSQAEGDGVAEAEKGFGEEVERGGFGEEVERGGVDIFEGQKEWKERVEKWVYGGDERNNVGVWVRGRLVYEKKKGAVGGKIWKESEALN